MAILLEALVMKIQVLVLAVSFINVNLIVPCVIGHAQLRKLAQVSLSALIHMSYTDGKSTSRRMDDQS
jgi:hypothetical protein